MNFSGLKKKRNVFLGILAWIFIIIFIAGTFFSLGEEAVSAFFEAFPYPQAIYLFIFVYVAGSFLIWQLKDVMKVIGVALFGVYTSTILICVSETANAVIFFIISRALGKDWAEKKLKGWFLRVYLNLQNIQHSWFFLLRGLPVVPFRMLDMTAGLSSIHFRRYFFIVLLATPLRIFPIQFVLAGVQASAQGRGLAYFYENSTITAALGIYFLAGLLAALRLKKRAKK